MNDFAEIGHWADTEWDRIRHPRHHDTPAVTDQPQPEFIPNDQTSQPVPASQEIHMPSPLLTDADKAAHALVSHVATLLANPLVDAIVGDGLGLALTPGEVAAVTAFVKAIEADRAPVTAAAPALTAAPVPDGGNGASTDPRRPVTA